jgi:hypothetical protein
MLLRRLVTLTSIFDELRDEFHAHLTGDAATAEPVLIAELVDIRNRQAVIDGHHRYKQPDWTYRATSSGSTPVELKRLYRPTPTR